MTEQEIDQKFDEMLMYIYAGRVGSGRNTFANTIQSAVNEKLDQVIEILEKKNAITLANEIRQLKNI